jgi:hypothetical protein
MSTELNARTEVFNLAADAQYAGGAPALAVTPAGALVLAVTPPATAGAEAPVLAHPATRPPKINAVAGITTRSFLRCPIGPV